MSLLLVSLQIPIVQFVHDVVVKFLEDDDPFVRKAAAVTCCKVGAKPASVNSRKDMLIDAVHLDCSCCSRRVRMRQPGEKMRRLSGP